MAAMRFMHLGRDSHVLGEATAPSVRHGDVLVAVSGSGETPVTVAFARIAGRRLPASAFLDAGDVVVGGDEDVAFAVLDHVRAFVS